MDEVQQLAAAGELRDTTRCRKVARRALLNMDYAALSPSQRSLLDEAEFVAYHAELKQLAVEPVNYFRLLRKLEHSERQPSSLPAKTVRVGPTMAAVLVHRTGSGGTGTPAGHAVSQRQSASRRRDSLINRLIPTNPPVAEQIDEVIMGARTWGRGEAVTRLKVHLIPSERSWRFGLELDGNVALADSVQPGARDVLQPGSVVVPGQEGGSSAPRWDRPVRGGGGGRRPDATGRVDHRDRRFAPAGRTRRANCPPPVRTKQIAGSFGDGTALAWRVAHVWTKRSASSWMRRASVSTTISTGPCTSWACKPLPLEMRTTEQRVITQYRLAGSISWRPTPRVP